MTARRVLRRAFVVTGCGLVLASCSGREAADSERPARQAQGDALVLDSAQRTRIRVDTLVQSSFIPAIVTTGTVAFNADRSTQVLAPISGPVGRVLVSPGAKVSQGEPLATVASPDFATAVAGYRKAQAAWRNAKRVADLDEQLYATDALARRDLDQARTDLASATADRDAAVEQLRALGVDVGAVDAGAVNAAIDAVVRAPIAGTVVERNITPGLLLQAGTTVCFTIADISTVWVMANVFERDIAAVQAGETATITTDAAHDTIVGRVDYVAALVDPASKATAVRIVAPNPGGVLRRDMYVSVTIRGARPRTGLLLPIAAVLRDDENLPFVFVVLANGSYARRRIELGGRTGDRYEVASGLMAGEAVVVDGGLFLQAAGSP